MIDRDSISDASDKAVTRTTVFTVADWLYAFRQTFWHHSLTAGTFSVVCSQFFLTPCLLSDGNASETLGCNILLHLEILDHK